MPTIRFSFGDPEMQPLTHRHTLPIPLLIGPGAVSNLGDVAAELGMSEPLLVTDDGLRQCGHVDIALRSLGKLASRTAVFASVVANPTEKNVSDALELYHRSESDGIVAVGGGSVIDAAKALRLLVAHAPPLGQYGLLQGGMRRITEEMPPLVAVPTTAGTGSEVSRGALIVTESEGRRHKTLVASPRLVPSTAILDSGLTLDLPPALTAGTGMDALSHCIEEYFSPRYHPVVDALAAGAAKRIARALPLVWEDPGHQEARGEMMVAAMMAGIGFEKGLGITHSFSHAIGAHHDLHHGLLNAVLLPVALEFNRDHLREGSARDFCASVGLSSASDSGAVEALSGWCRQLNAEMGIPSRLRDLGLMAGDRDAIVAAALEDHCHQTNPRRCGKDEMLEFWERAY